MRGAKNEPPNISECDGVKLASCLRGAKNEPPKISECEGNICIVELSSKETLTNHPVDCERMRTKV